MQQISETIFHFVIQAIQALPAKPLIYAMKKNNMATIFQDGTIESYLMCFLTWIVIE